MTPDEFIKTLLQPARISAAKTNVPASFTLAEAALESGWGSHAPGMNLFGVKADASWKGPVTIKRTREFINGLPVIVEAKFRAYKDWFGSIEDHAEFLLRNPRYKPAFQFRNGENFAKAIAKAGYATDPDYADKLIAVMDSHDLQQYDKA